MASDSGHVIQQAEQMRANMQEQIDRQKQTVTAMLEFLKEQGLVDTFAEWRRSHPEYMPAASAEGSED